MSAYSDEQIIKTAKKLLTRFKVWQSEANLSDAYTCKPENKVWEDFLEQCHRLQFKLWRRKTRNLK